MGDLIEFHNIFDNTIESQDITTLHNAMFTMLDEVDAENSAVVFDVKCLTRPYTNNVDTKGMTLYSEVVARGVAPYFFSWEVDTPANLAAETARLTALGVADPIILLRDTSECNTPKKNLGWNASIASYTRRRAATYGLTRTIVMYVGRKWVDVLPENILATSLPSTDTEHHLLCRHKESGVWCLRMSPSKIMQS